MFSTLSFLPKHLIRSRDNAQLRSIKNSKMYVQSAWVSILVLTTGLLSSRQSEKIKNEKDGPFDANKYFYIIKMGLELKVSKLTESLLYIIQVSNPSHSDS